MRRVLIVHPEADVRTSIDATLRAAGPKPLVVESAASLADGLRRARSGRPHVVYLDITTDRTLVLQAAAELRAPERTIVGLYNPLVLRGDLADLRVFTRAGIDDFVPLPASESDVLGALSTVDPGVAAIAEGRVITFFSPQGGAGVTSLAVNVAVLMAGSGQVQGPVVLCDAALQFGMTASFLGVSPARDLGDFVRDPQGESALAACLSEEPSSGLHLLAAPRDPIVGDVITPDDMTRVLVDLRRRFPWVVVDTPPVLDLLTLAVLDSSDAIFVVTEATTPAVLAVERLLRALAPEQLDERVRIVLSKFTSFEGNLSETSVAERLHRPVDHIVPLDRGFVTAANRGRPIVMGRMASAVESALSDIGDDAAGLRRRPLTEAR